MNKENTETLMKDFPSLYRGAKQPPTQNLMCFGFECDDGWFGLIYDLSRKLFDICPRVKAAQVKEKFGTLRFYVECVQANKADKVYSVIQEAEIESGKICENCGSKKKVKCKSTGGSYWIKTLCEECRRKDEDKRKGNK